MEPLPHIDEHATEIGASRERVWAALARRFDVEAGGVTGFAVAAAEPPARLELRGRHPFSRYALTFLLEDAGAGRSRLRARSDAVFPGPHGRVYRALVIGSGGHKLIVRRMLARIARSA